MSPSVFKARARQRTAADHRLRALVARNQGCLGSLSPTQQRLLELRAGTGGAQPRSASAVARILRVSVGRESRLESGALVALRSLASSGCSAAPAVLVISPDHQLVASAPWLAGASSTTPSASNGASQVSQPSSGRGGGGGALTSAVAPAATPVSPSGAGKVQRAEIGGRSSGSILPVVLIGLLAAAAMIALAPAGRRRLRVAMATRSPAARSIGSDPARSVALAASAAPAASARLTAPAPVSAPPAGNGATPADAAPPLPDSTSAPASTGRAAEPRLLPAQIRPAAPIVPAAGAKLSASATLAHQLSRFVGPGRDWLRRRGSQVALLFVILGGAARLLLRPSSRHGRGRRR